MEEFGGEWEECRGVCGRVGGAQVELDEVLSWSWEPQEDELAVDVICGAGRDGVGFCVFSILRLFLLHFLSLSLNVQ